MKLNELSHEQTLYVCRPLELKSAQHLRAWAKSQGFDKTLDPSDMHVTLAFSKQPVDWSALKPVKKAITVGSGGRTVTPLGDKGAVVLKLRSAALTDRWNQFIDMGCSWDYDDYTPHVTISYGGTSSWIHAAAYDQPIVLAAEKWNPVVLDWEKSVKET